MAPRIQLVLLDMSQEVPRHLGVWHMFLVSDVPLACIQAGSLRSAVLCLASICFRLGHMYNYSFELFRKKFIGEDGALWSQK